MATVQVNPRDNVIEQVYSAAGGLNPWNDALAHLSDYCGATASYINVLPEPGDKPYLVGAYGHAANLIERYRSYGHLLDPTTPQIIANAGHAISFSDLLHRELGSPAFHKEFIASRGTAQVLAIGLQSDVGVLLVKLSRVASGRPFSEDAAGRLQEIAYHVRQAVVIDRSLRRQLKANSFAASIVYHLRAAVVRLDHRLKIMFANPAAHRLAADGQVISVSDGTFRFGEPGLMEAFRAFLRKTAVGAADRNHTVLLSGGDERRRIRVWAWCGNDQSERDIGLVILPDDFEAEILETMLRDNYSLTPSEIRTAIGVLSHNGLAAVAESTGVSVETVRFHLKRIFSKTGTCRQSELVRVIANDLCCFGMGDAHISS